jgi:hypothetical protein
MSGSFGENTTFIYLRVLKGLMISKEVHDGKCTSLF